MPLSSQRDDESNHQLVVKIDNVKNIYFLLKAINFQEVRLVSLFSSFLCFPYAKCLLFKLYSILLQKATCFATENGLKVTVEESKCIQASAFIQRDIFQVI